MPIQEDIVGSMVEFEDDDEDIIIVNQSSRSSSGKMSTANMYISLLSLCVHSLNMTDKLIFSVKIRLFQMRYKNKMYFFIMSTLREEGRDGSAFLGKRVFLPLPRKPYPLI